MSLCFAVIQRNAVESAASLSVKIDFCDKASLWFGLIVTLADGVSRPVNVQYVAAQTAAMSLQACVICGPLGLYVALCRLHWS